MFTNKIKTLAAGVAVSAVFAASPALAATVYVTSEADTGPGTFRQAVLDANGDSSIDEIKFKSFVDTVALESKVVYTGAQTLLIDGNGAEITPGAAPDDLFEANGGGNLTLREISFLSALQSGVVVNVPSSATGEQAVTLDRVILKDNGWYGLHFDDQSGGDGAGADSDASLVLTVRKSQVINNNNFAIEIDPADADKDGIRVDEGGYGDVTAFILDSVLNENEAEGIEIDEKGPGDVVVTANDSTFSDNGAQRQFPDDLEDGLDVDEAGEGDIWVTLIGCEINGNRDEGLDLDGEDAGDIYVLAVKLDASENFDENVKVSLVQNVPVEEGEGKIVARFTRSTVLNSEDGDGIKLENYDNGTDENLAGFIDANIQNSTVTANDSDDVQIEADAGKLTIRNSDVGEIDTEDDDVILKILP